MRRITCINDDNVSIVLGDTFSPFVLTDAEGLYEVRNNLYTNDNTSIDGAAYQGSVVTKREITLSIADKSLSNHQQNRELLYAVFKPASKGRLIYEENGLLREIGYYVESVFVESIPSARPATISLVCPDPFFTDTGDILVEMAGWEPLFEFPFEIPASGIEFEQRVNERLKTIQNNSAAESTGMNITLTAIGTVVNPTIEHVQKNEHITLGSSSRPFTMVSGDQLVISTEDGNKHAYLIRDGVTSNVNYYMSEDSTFIQLRRGMNSIGYSSEEGESYIMVSIAFRYKYLGV